MANQNTIATVSFIPNKMKAKHYILKIEGGERAIINMDDVSSVHTSKTKWSLSGHDPHEVGDGVLTFNFKSGASLKSGSVKSVQEEMGEIACFLNSDIDDLRRDNESLKHQLKQAKESSMASIREAIVKTLNVQGRQGRMDASYMMAYGRQYTIRQVLEEVKQNTQIGKDIVHDLNMLTIDRLLRGKEEIKREDV